MRNEHHHEGGRRGGPRSDDTAFDRPRGPGGPRPGFGRRRQRGDVRAGLLVALLDGSAHGYQLIQTLAAKSGGGWQPSPGAVYPSLEALLDEQLVTVVEADGRRVFTLTDAGRAVAEERRATGGPWGEGGAEPDARGRLFHEVRSLAAATKLVAMAGSTAQAERAVAIVAQARKDLYRLMADD